MLKIALILVGLSVLCRWALGKWPWEYLKAPSTRSQAVFRARKLLAVQERASRNEIIAAHKRLVAMVHPDKGGSDAQVHEANAARDLLLDELPDDGALPQ
uniref:J domain-containing protein n=1 Tax=Parerythrobacter lutipelagi TaxID=1964208 RepID=UPI0010F7D2C7|nr:J domain-containing protein [Parerythrobacter lutipelagi]